MSALATCVKERKEPDALGIFVEITSPKFLATILMLHDVFVGVQPLNLALQKSGESFVLTDIPLYLDKTMSFLKKLVCKHKTKFQQIVRFFQISSGITSAKFSDSVKPII